MSKNADLWSVFEQNDRVALCYSRYLNYSPRIISPDMVHNLANECHVDRHEAYLSLFSAVLGWEPDESPADRALEHRYLRPGLHRLSPADYLDNPYLRTVRFPTQACGTWELRHSSYAPYEPFVCNHPVCTEELREIPQIGYFESEFHFPAVLENGIEWMTVTPNEIETMKEPIANSHGRVLTLGLGLGYFAFMASEKPNVESVTVVERDARVIELFCKHLLPQFPNKQKIQIVQGDAIAYMEALSSGQFDRIFADLWHDQGDGLELYLKLRRIERKNRLCGVDYWIEPTLLSSLRHMVAHRLREMEQSAPHNNTNPYDLLSNDYLKALAPDVVRAESS